MSDGGFTREEFDDGLRVAEERNCDVIVGNDRLVLLDLDTPEAIERARQLWEKAVRWFGCRLREKYSSRSGAGHMHLVLELDTPLDVRSRIALQAAMGSDPVKELISLRRLANGIEEPCRLFKPRT